MSALICLGRTTYERRASNQMQLKKYTPQSIVQSANTRRQIVIDRLKAMSVFDKPLEESLTEQTREIDDEILQLTTDLDSVLGSELTQYPSS